MLRVNAQLFTDAPDVYFLVVLFKGDGVCSRPRTHSPVVCRPLSSYETVDLVTQKLGFQRAKHDGLCSWPDYPLTLVRCGASVSN